MTNEESNEKILLWQAPMNNEPEPYIELKYKDLVVAIPYTAVNLMSGWLAIGSHNSCDLTCIAPRISMLFNYLEKCLSNEANPLTKEEIDFYEKHGLLNDPPKLPKELLELPKIK